MEVDFLYEGNVPYHFSTTQYLSTLINSIPHPPASYKFIETAPAMYDLQGPTTSGTFAPNTTRHQTKLWVDSEITGKYVTTHLPLSKEQRFKWASIYWPEDNDQLFALKRKRKSQVHEMAAKIAKLIDEQQKNEARINQIKRSFSIGKSSATKDSGKVQSTKKPFKLSKDNQEIVMRLTHSESKKQSVLRDRHGNRCNMYEDPQMDQREEIRNFSNSTGFKTSRKMKLQLPHNYYPGPGSYQIKRYLQNLDIKSAREAKTNPESTMN